MPLTQDRFISLIEATAAAMNTLEGLKTVVGMYRNCRATNDAGELLWKLRNSDDEMLREEIITTLARLAESHENVIETIAQTQVPIAAIIAFTEEKAHFKATSRRNETARDAMRRLRIGRRRESSEEYLKGRIEEQRLWDSLGPNAISEIEPKPLESPPERQQPKRPSGPKVKKTEEGMIASLEQMSEEAREQFEQQQREDAEHAANSTGDIM